MRIIAGRFKGRRLKTPTWDGAAADVRQAARDAVQHPGAAHRRARGCSTALPAPARSASRRSAAARRTSTFVERDRARAALIAENLAACGVEEGYAIIRGDVAARAARALHGATHSTSIVLDPPYDVDRASTTCSTPPRPPGRRRASLVLEHAHAGASPDGAAGARARARRAVRRQRVDVLLQTEPRRPRPDRTERPPRDLSRARSIR